MLFSLAAYGSKIRAELVSLVTKLFENFQGNRFAKQVTLKFTATILTQKGKLFIGLDALGYQFQIKIIGNVNNGAHHHAAVFIAGYVAHKRLVNFELFQWQPGEVGK